MSQEFDPVSAVKSLQADRFTEGFEDQSGSLCSIEIAGGEPAPGTDHIGLDQCVFEVKGSELTAFVEHLFAQPLGAAECGTLLARGSCFDSTLFQNRRQVDMDRIVMPVDDLGVHREHGLVFGTEAGVHGQGVVAVVQRFTDHVFAVEVDVSDRLFKVLFAFVEGGRELSPFAANRQRSHDLAGAVKT